MAEFLCLANSRKLSGRCVAGLVPGHGWVRPVPDSSGSAVATSRSKHFGLLDVVTVDLGATAPLNSQPENVLLGPKGFSEVRDHDPAHLWEELEALIDDNPELLARGRSDCIPTAEVAANAVKSSLCLVEPNRVRWRRKISFGRPQVRCLFELRESVFDLVVTDLAVEQALGQARPGLYDRDVAGLPSNQRMLLAVSLGEAYKGHHYKLVAGVLTLDR